jgi:sarcosine oxidase
VSHGAKLLGSTPVTGIEDRGSHLTVETSRSSFTCRAVVVCADAWTNQVLARLGVAIPLTVTLEQATYFQPTDPAPFADMPLWIWMDEPSYYGFPCYGEATIKAAQDCGGPIVDPDHRTSDPDPEMLDRLASFVGSLLPGSGRPVRSLRCQYTLTPDRDFVLAPVPGHPSVVVGLAAAHGFKFAPTFGRILADLVTTGETSSDISAFGFGRPALTDPAYEPNWMV